MGSLLEKYGFHEWLCKTNFSFLVGASHPEELILQANKFSYGSLALNDFDGVYGLARGYRDWIRLKEDGGLSDQFKMNFGVEVHLHHDHDRPLLLRRTLVLIAQSYIGYGNLCRILTNAHSVSQEKARAVVSLDLLLSSNVTDLVVLQPMRGFVRESQSSLDYQNLKAHFQGRLYFVVSRHLHRSEDMWVSKALSLSREFDVPFLLSQDAFFHEPKRKRLQDTLNVIRTNRNFASSDAHLFPNAERCFHELEHLHELYRAIPGYESALKASCELNESCDFSFNQLRYTYPREMIPEGYTAHSFLETLVWKGAKDRFGDEIPDKVKQNLWNELSLIQTLDFADYFLTVWDIVRWARAQDILCQGRGSAANSSICFVLGITSVNPNLFDLLFERFISLERGDPPDIDVDFEHERREEVIQYIYRRYGRNRAAMIANVITFRRKGALRAVGKAFGVSENVLSAVSNLAKTALYRRQDNQALFDVLKQDASLCVHEIEHLPLDHWLDLAEVLVGFPRHLGIHSGGFIISQNTLDQLVPQEPASMEGRTVIQWSKEDVEGLGLFKIDVLSLGMLTALRKSFQMVEKFYGTKLSLYGLPKDDIETYRMIQRADTVGVFQIESRAQMSMLVRLKPKTFYDLVVEVAIVRPGPIQGKIIHPYLERRDGLKPVTYPHPKLKPILERTLGVSIFQEQAMRIAIAVGDFTPGEANELRKNIGVWNMKDFTRNLNPWLDKLQQGMRSHGISESDIESLMNQLKGFAHYGFPESHAVSFALIAYASSYIKCHYPAAFFAAILNSQPMGFYSPHSLIQSAQRARVPILPLSIHRSVWDHQLEEVGKRDGSVLYGIRLGFRIVSGLARKAIEEFSSKRQALKRWKDFDDFLQSGLLYRDDVTALAAANVFEEFGLSRSEALWQAEAVPLKPMLDLKEREIQWQKESKLDQMQRDFKSFGTSLGDHPTVIIKSESWCYPVPFKSLLTSQQLNRRSAEQKVHTFGMVLTKQAPPSAKGMVFYTLEDEKGHINLAFTPQVYERYFQYIEKNSFLCVRGKLQRATEYHSILVDHVYPPFVNYQKAAPKSLNATQNSDERQKELFEDLYSARDYG